eukprot:COSAG05_NODE_965_length_6403_cov_50.682741_10_plen_31_part_01
MVTLKGDVEEEWDTDVMLANNFNRLVRINLI